MSRSKPTQDRRADRRSRAERGTKGKAVFEAGGRVLKLFGVVSFLSKRSGNDFQS